MRESGPRKRDDDGDVDEDDHHGDGSPGGTPAPGKQGGESPPTSSSSSLTSSLDRRRVSPLVLGSHVLGGARAPLRLDLSLRFCILGFCPGTLSFISGDP